MIDNAIKYSPADGKIEIDVWSDPTVSIAVSDEGPGFPLDEIETLTARFTRGSNADKTIGSGLGLTIAQDVAKAHGGEITLRNREEGGACVILSL